MLYEIFSGYCYWLKLTTSQSTNSPTTVLWKKKKENRYYSDTCHMESHPKYSTGIYLKIYYSFRLVIKSCNTDNQHS